MADDTIVRCLLCCLCALVIPTAVTIASEPTQICGAPNYDVRNLTARYYMYFSQRWWLPTQYCEAPWACPTSRDSALCEPTLYTTDQEPILLGLVLCVDFSVMFVFWSASLHLFADCARFYTLCINLSLVKRIEPSAKWGNALHFMIIINPKPKVKVILTPVINTIKM